MRLRTSALAALLVSIVAARQLQFPIRDTPNCSLDVKQVMSERLRPDTRTIEESGKES